MEKLKKNIGKKWPQEYRMQETMQQIHEENLEE